MTIPNLYSLTQHHVAMSGAAKLRRLERIAPRIQSIPAPQATSNKGGAKLQARVQHLEIGLRRQTEQSGKDRLIRPATAVLDIENSEGRQGNIKLSLSAEGLALLKEIYVEADVEQLTKLIGQLIDVAELEGPYLPSSIELESPCNRVDKTSLDLCAEQVVDRIVAFNYNGEVDDHPALAKAIECLALNYNKRLSLGDLASQAFVSPSHLSYLFKQHLGLSFKKFLIELRIASAKVQLLEHPRRKVTVIAYEVGFHDLSHFEKTFKRVVGISPGRFRKAR